MAKKVKTPDLKFEDLKVNQVYRGKNPKIIGVFGRAVDDRQILYISEFRCIVGYIDHRYLPAFEDWCKESGTYRHNYSFTN